MNSLNKKQFELRCLTEDHVATTKTFMLKHFIPNDPLSETFKVKWADVTPRVLQRVDETCKSGLSTGCFEKSTGKLVGVLLCTIYKENSAPFPTSYPPELVAMVKFLNWLGRDLHKELNARKISDQEIAATDPEYARNGIFGALSEKCDELAKKSGCEYVTSELVSLYAIKGSQKIGRTVLREVYYMDYVDPETGKQPYMHFSPIHNYAQLVYNKL